jgi:hypothetical protein
VPYSDIEPFLPGIAEDFDDYLRQMALPGVWGGASWALWFILMAVCAAWRTICARHERNHT